MCVSVPAVSEARESQPGCRGVNASSELSGFARSAVTSVKRFWLGFSLGGVMLWRNLEMLFLVVYSLFRRDVHSVLFPPARRSS